MNSSHKSKPQYLPRFPRIQRLLEKRALERIREGEQDVFLDSENRVHVNPQLKYKH